MKKNPSESSKQIIVRLKGLAIILLFSLLQVGCTTYEIDSIWRSEEITIDGNSSDWMGKLIYIEDANVSVGIQNDEDNLYLCLVAENQFIRAQMMSQGMTLWIDPAGGKEKVLGIRYPIGNQSMRMKRQPMSPEEDREARRERLQKAMTEATAELEIIGPGESNIKRLAIDKANGIEVAFQPSSGVTVYELKVPLLPNEQQPFAVGTQAGNTFGMGLEIPKMDRSAMKGARQGGMGGRRPGGGGMPGGGQRGGMGRRPQFGEGLKLWAAVQLALE
jgi:hypothetical protein